MNTITAIGIFFIIVIKNTEELMEWIIITKDTCYYTIIIIIFFNFDNNIIGIIPITATPTPIIKMSWNFHFFIII